MNSTNPNQKLKVTDNTSLGEIYVNKVVTVSFDGGAVVATLGATRMVPSKIGDGVQPELPTVHVTGRIALSPPAAVELVNAIQGVLVAAQMTAQAAASKPPVGKVN